MSASSLLSSIISTTVPLRSVTSVRIRVIKKSLPSTHQASLRHFIEKRLPVLRFNNPSLQVSIERVKNAANGGAGIQIQRFTTAGNAMNNRTSSSSSAQSYILNHQQLRDDELFQTVLAVDRAGSEKEITAIPGVTKGEMEGVVASAAAATPAAASSSSSNAAPKKQ